MLAFITLSAHAGGSLPLENKPFTLAIDFMFVEGDLSQFVLSASFVGPTTNIILGRPPVEVGNHQSICGPVFNWSVI